MTEKGYNWDLVVHKEKALADKLQCSLCLGVFKNVVATPLGCEFCLGCVVEQIKTASNNEFTCNCNAETLCNSTKLNCYKRTQGIVDLLEIKCRYFNADIPCDWHGPVSQYQSHVDSCTVDCEMYRMDSCFDECRVKVLRTKLDAHKLEAFPEL